MASKNNYRSLTDLRKFLCKPILTMTVHIKIWREEERAQNIERAPTLSISESRLQFEDASDQNGLKDNLPVIAVFLLHHYPLHSISTVHDLICFSLQSVGTVQHISFVCPIEKLPWMSVLR